MAFLLAIERDLEEDVGGVEVTRFRSRHGVGLRLASAKVVMSIL